MLPDSTTGRSSPRDACGDYLYIGSHSGKLITINLKEHKVAWTVVTDGARQNAAALTNAQGAPDYQAVYGDFFYDDMVSGAKRIFSLGSVLPSPVLSGATLYFGSWDGQLYAVGELFGAGHLLSLRLPECARRPARRRTRQHATACTTAATRTALCTASRSMPCWRSCRSCEAMRAACCRRDGSASGSKSALAMPGAPITFMRRRAGSFAYSRPAGARNGSTRCSCHDGRGRVRRIHMGGVRCRGDLHVAGETHAFPEATAAASATAHICRSFSCGAPARSAQYLLSDRSRVAGQRIADVLQCGCHLRRPSGFHHPAASCTDSSSVCGASVRAEPPRGCDQH